MSITDEMLKAAIIKSVEAGLLPRRALKEDFPHAQEIMHAILSSALQSAASKTPDAEMLQIKRKETVQHTMKTPSTQGQFLPADLHSFY